MRFYVFSALSCLEIVNSNHLEPSNYRSVVSKVSDFALPGWNPGQASQTFSGKYQ